MEKEIIKKKIGEIINSTIKEIDSILYIKESLNNDIISQRRTIDTLSEKIVNTQELLDYQEKIINHIDILKSENNNLENKNNILLKDISYNEDKLNTVKNSIKLMLSKSEQELESFKTKTEDERNFLKEERLRLDDFKKKLDKKDEELKIVENRFVRLFEGKGSSFRISEIN